MLGNVLYKSNRFYKSVVKMTSQKGGINMKSKRAKALDISASVKKKVFERDRGRCVICGSSYNVMPNSHFVRRGRGGLGIEENIFTACTNLTENRCHERYDRFKCTDVEKQLIILNFKRHYPNWNEEDLYYNKQKNLP